MKKLHPTQQIRASGTYVGSAGAKEPPPRSPQPRSSSHIPSTTASVPPCARPGAAGRAQIKLAQHKETSTLDQCQEHPFIMDDFTVCTQPSVDQITNSTMRGHKSTTPPNPKQPNPMQPNPMQPNPKQPNPKQPNSMQPNPMQPNWSQLHLTERRRVWASALLPWGGDKDCWTDKKCIFPLSFNSRGI